MAELTREQLIEKLERRLAVTTHYPDVEEAQLDAQIFKIALAALTAEPVAHLVCNGRLYQDRAFLSFSAAQLSVKDRNDRAEIKPLYASPQLPQPAVPEFDALRLAFEATERKSDNGFNLHKSGIGYADEATQLRWEQWVACRAAMIQGAESVQGWIACSERMPCKLIPVMVMYEDGEMWSAIWTGTKWDDGTDVPDPHTVTHWQEMPAAPQQES